MLGAYFKFCASIYWFYKRKKDSIPEAMAFWLTSLIVTANALTIYDFLSFYYFTNLDFNALIAFSFFGLISMINFLSVFYKGLYKDLRPSRKFGIATVLYMILSIVAIIYSGYLHRERNIQKMHENQIVSKLV